MIAVAVIYSVTATLGKMAIEHSSPLFFGITYFCAAYRFVCADSALDGKA